MATFQKRERVDGTVGHRVQIRITGHEESATFDRLTDAKWWAAETELAIRQERHFPKQESTHHTLAELIDRYIKEVLPTKPKSVAAQSQQLKWWKLQLGDRSLADVTPSLISERREMLAKKGARDKPLTPATVNRYLAALSHVYTVAIKDWEWAEDSPVKNVRRYREPRGRTRFLSDDERERLLDACQQSSNIYLLAVVVLALSTGMRYSEIMTLTTDDVNIEDGRILLRETKNGEQRMVPLTGQARRLVNEVLEYRRPDDTNLLFPSDKRPQKGRQRKPVELRVPWKAAVKKAEIGNFRFHDLRHTAASYLAMNGASLIEIGKILGHKTLQMVKRYAHLSEGHTAQVVASMNEKIFGKATADAVKDPIPSPP
jgi:integrase